VTAEDLAHEPLGAIAHDGAAQLPRRGDSQPRVPALAGEDEDGHQAARNAPPTIVDLLEILAAPDPAPGGKTGSEGHRVSRSRLARRRDGQAFPAFGPTSLQHDAAVLRAHAHEEAVRAAPPPVIGLKSTLHDGIRTSRRDEPHHLRSAAGVNHQV